MSPRNDRAAREVLLEQAEMIQRAADESVPEAEDRADVERAYQGLVLAAGPRGALASKAVLGRSTVARLAPARHAAGL